MADEADEMNWVEVKEAVEKCTKTVEDYRKEVEEVKGSIDPAKQEKMDRNLTKALEGMNEVTLSLEKSAEVSEKMQQRLDDAELVLAKGNTSKDGDSLRTKFDDMQASWLRNGNDVSGIDMKEFKDGVIESVIENELCQKDGIQVDALRHEMKSMVAGSNPDGGYFVTPDMRGRIETRAFRTSPIRQLATVTNTTKDSVEWILDDDEAGFEWVGEVQSRSTTDTPQVGKVIIPVHEMAAKPKISQKLIDDAGFDIESWLSQKVSDRFGRGENTAFVAGDGVLKPRGFLDYADANAAVTYDGADAYERGKLGSFEIDINAGNDDVVADGLKEFQSILKPEYDGNAAWLLNHKLFGQKIVTLKDSNNQYLLRFGDSLREGDTLRLLGKRVVLANDMPASGASGTYPIAYGDFREGYMIVDRIGIRVLRDPYTDKPFIQFYTTKRTGGAVVNFDALKRIKQA